MGLTKEGTREVSGVCSLFDLGMDYMDTAICKNPLSSALMIFTLCVLRFCLFVCFLSHGQGSLNVVEFVLETELKSYRVGGKGLPKLYQFLLDGEGQVKSQGPFLDSPQATCSSHTL